MHNVLVTGNRGYLGSAIVNQLLEQGHEVTGYTSGRTSPQLSQGIPEIQKDIRDVQPEDLTGIDAIIHLAALPTDKFCDTYPEAGWEINVNATSKLAELARIAGIPRFIFASALAVYGNPSSEMVSEQDIPKPTTRYGETKYAAEQELRSIEGISVCILRPGLIYGAAPQVRLDSAFNSFIATAYFTNEVSLRSDGNAWKPIIHVQDAARGFLHALENGLSGTYNLLSGNRTLKDLAELAAETMHAQLSIGTEASAKSYKVSNDLFRATGWKPQFTPEEGIRDIQAFLTNVPQSRFPEYDPFFRTQRLKLTGSLRPA